MPKQEVFFEQQDGDRKIEVLKSYDRGYAREAFKMMDDQALQRLWTALEVEENYDPADLPKLNIAGDAGNDAEDFLWDELLEQALEDPRASPRQVSFFIVNEIVGHHSESLYVSPDWPSAEAFAKSRVAAAL